MSRDANNPEYYFVDKENLENMGMTPRDLTQQENETLIKIALNVNPVKEKIKQGMSYRTQIGWASYNKNSIFGWSLEGHFTKYLIKKPNTYFTYFPVVEIGLGTPQQYFIVVVGDLGSGKAVYASVNVDKHVPVPDYVKPLTEEQKAKLIEIGSNTEDFKMFIGSSKYNTSFQWVAISKNRGEIHGLDYDIFETGIQDIVPLESASMTVYPAVVFESSSWRVREDIDLENSKIVNSLVTPVRMGPPQVPE